MDTCELGLQETDDRRPTWHQGPPSFESEPLPSAVSLRVRTPPDFFHSNSFFTESDCVAGFNFMGVVFSKNTSYWRRRGSMKSQDARNPSLMGKKATSLFARSLHRRPAVSVLWACSSALQEALVCQPPGRDSSERSLEVWWGIRGQGPLLPGGGR